MSQSESSREWSDAGQSALSMYGNFFYWLFREPFPVRQLGQQIVRVMLEAFGVLMITAVMKGPSSHGSGAGTASSSVWSTGPGQPWSSSFSLKAPR